MPKAIDIVLIPPTDIFELSLALNARATETPVRLGHNVNLPHLSLLQAIAPEENIPLIIHRLKEIAADVPTVSVVINRITENSFHMENAGHLRELHERVITELQPLLSNKQGTQEDYYRPHNEVVTKDCFPWVNDFIAKASFDAFDPHITLWMQGNADTNDVTLPISYTNTHIALYHLGPYNTCTKQLWSNLES